jgi:hypothetical protein
MKTQTLVKRVYHTQIEQEIFNSDNRSFELRFVLNWQQGKAVSLSYNRQEMTENSKIA